jgi:hypothetical protein
MASIQKKQAAAAAVVKMKKIMKYYWIEIK